MVKYLVASFLTLAVWTGSVEAQSEDVRGPLAGQPAVRNLRIYREFRLNVVPTIGYSLQDEFSRAVFFGGQANFHFTDWLGLGVWGGGAAAVDTDLTSQITRNGQTTDSNQVSLPEPRNFSQQVGRIRWAASVHLLFAPLRGKLSFFQSLFVDTDLYILAGVGFFGVEERASCERGQCTAATQTTRSSRVAVTPMAGIGLSLYFNSWLGLALEWRAFPFSWNPSGTDESGLNRLGQPGSGFPDGQINGDDSRTTFNHMMTLGVIFNLPPDQRVSN